MIPKLLPMSVNATSAFFPIDDNPPKRPRVTVPRFGGQKLKHNRKITVSLDDKNDDHFSVFCGKRPIKPGDPNRSPDWSVAIAESLKEAYDEEICPNDRSSDIEEFYAEEARRWDVEDIWNDLLDYTSSEESSSDSEYENVKPTVYERSKLPSEYQRATARKVHDLETDNPDLEDIFKRLNLL